MKIDWSISVGHLLEGAIVIIAGIGVIYTLRGDVSNIKSEMANVRGELGKITEVLVTLGRQDERMKALDRRIDDLLARKE